MLKLHSALILILSKFPIFFPWINRFDFGMCVRKNKSTLTEGVESEHPITFLWISNEVPTLKTLVKSRHKHYAQHSICQIYLLLKCTVWYRQWHMPDFVWIRLSFQLDQMFRCHLCVCRPIQCNIQYFIFGLEWCMLPEPLWVCLQM